MKQDEINRWKEDEAMECDEARREWELNLMIQKNGAIPSVEELAGKDK